MGARYMNLEFRVNLFGPGNPWQERGLRARSDFAGRGPAWALALLLLVFAPGAQADSKPTKQESLNQWRNLTSESAPPPRVFVKGETIRFYFQRDGKEVGFGANWSRARVPAEGYRVDFATLRLDENLTRSPADKRGWREAVVVAGKDWRRLATNLTTALTPDKPRHGIYYQGFLADRLLYRDALGNLRTTKMDEEPQDIVIDNRFSIDETLEILAKMVEDYLSRTHPGESLFMILAPASSRFPQPLLIDRRQHRCVWLLPAPLYDPAERGFDLTATAQSLSAFFLEGHGVALLRNPISSAARLGDLGFETFVRFVRIPPLKPGTDYPALAHTNGMDLAAWEKWLDHYTGTRREDGSARFLINGEQFFPRLQEAIASATNHVNFEVFIFDKDDVAVDVANQLKERSGKVKVKVILDRLGSIAAGTVPPATPLPEDFVAPSSIISYLRKDSKVRVHPFLNPWMSADHTKLYLVDGTRAWLGGMNVGREYRYEWHDMMVEIEGPIVGSLEDQFRRDWAHAGPLGDLGYLGALLHTPQRSLIPHSPDGWTGLRLLPTETAWKPFSTAIQGALRQARSYIYAENPYLFDKRVIVGLALARARGVDVRVVLPRVNDFKAGGRGNLVVANYLLERGVRVYFYPGMTHVKAFMADDWACVGSGNLNHLSLRLCQEQNVATSDPALAAQLKHDLFEEDFARSYELTAPVSVDWVDFMTDLVLEGF